MSINFNGLSKKKLLISLFTIISVAAIAIGGTIAYFSDTETSTGNKFVAGKFNLKIDNTCHYNGKVCSKVGDVYLWEGTQEPCFCTWTAKDLTNELFFNFLDVKPGDNGEDTVSLHVDNNDAWVCAVIANLKNNDNGCDAPENLVDVPASCGNPGLGQGELADNIFFTVWRDNGADNFACNNILDSGEQILVNNQNALAGYWPLADSAISGGPIKGGGTTCFGIKWNVPISTGNIIQTDSLEGDVKFTAVQARNMDTFKCSDLFTEVCDQVDNDYDGATDEDWPTLGQACSVGVGACSATGVNTCNANSTGPVVCSAVAGTPATEICDGIDNNCNGQVDEGNPGGNNSCSTGLLGMCSAGATQCQNGAISCVQSSLPSPEICNGIDDDCDGSVDEGVKNTYYRNLDNDGYGNPSVSTQACTAPAGYVSDNTDCKDNDPSVHPGATEVAGNNLDEDCSGTVACYIDADNDTYGSSGISPNAYPATSGVATTNCNVNNIDGFDDTSGDCNDSNQAIRPGAMEACNNIDDDCDSMTDEGLSMRNYYKDYDNDTYGNASDYQYRCGPIGYYDVTWIGQADCNDNDSSIYPFAQEYCDGVDEDCDGTVDDSFPEQWTTCRSCPFYSPSYQCVSGALYCPACGG